MSTSVRCQSALMAQRELAVLVSQTTKALAQQVWALSVVNISQLCVLNSFIALSGPGNTAPSSQHESLPPVMLFSARWP